MNEPTSLPPDPLERLLVEHLDREASRLDAGSVLSRIRSTMAVESLPAPVSPAPAPAAPVSRSYRWLRWIGGLATAACLFLAGGFFWNTDQPLKASSPQALLQEAQKTLHQPVYRCYLVEVQRKTDLTDDSNPFVSFSRQTRLWTRGDRFWIESSFPKAPNIRNYWGRDEQGTTWMTFGPREGVLFQPSETPRWLQVYGDLCSMQPDRLLAEVLRDFDLDREAAPDGSASHTIKATLKPGRWHPALKEAVLELDAETKALRRVTLRRVPVEGVNLTTTYTLLETKNQDEVEYPLDGREGKREFYTADYKPERRQQLLVPLFGQRASEWMRPPVKLPLKKP
jgi:hypothetical protein